MSDSTTEQTLRSTLLLAQFALARQNRAVLIVLAGTDHVGCEQTIDRLHEWLDARFIDCAVFDEPPPPGPALQRYWQALPQRGRVAIHYGGSAVDLIAARCAGRIDAEAFSQGIVHERGFIRQLVADGMVVLRLWLDRAGGHNRRHGEWRLDRADWPAIESGEKALRIVRRYHAAWNDGPSQWQMFASDDPAGRDGAILAWLSERLTLAAATAPTPTAPPRDLPAAIGGDRLGRLSPAPTVPDPDYFDRLAHLQKKLHRWSGKAREAGLSSVVLFEGRDAAGKGGAIRRLAWAMNAANYRVAAIGAPNDRERGYPYLWRFWTRLPPTGRMLILDRSWYGRVLVERVEGFAGSADWQRAYGEIADFETQLVDAGVVLVKIWLQIDADEQLRRFEERATISYKKHKLGPEDWRNRARWNDYDEAIAEMIARTDRPRTPWTVIPANDKRAARLAVLETVNRALRHGLHR